MPEFQILVDTDELWDPIDVPADGDFHTIVLTVEPDGESLRVEVDGAEVYASPKIT